MNWGNLAIVIGLLGAGSVAGFFTCIMFTSGQIADLQRERDWLKLEVRLLKNQREQN